MAEKRISPEISTSKPRRGKAEIERPPSGGGVTRTSAEEELEELARIQEELAEALPDISQEKREQGPLTSSSQNTDEFIAEGLKGEEEAYFGLENSISREE